MSYVSEISNALGARGNALAQGELQRGQVYGNLAQNLGQIPFQALAFDQQRQAALQNNEIKKMALEKAQRDADLEKELVRISNSGLPPDQADAAIQQALLRNPHELQNYLAAKGNLELRQQQKYKLLEGQPGTDLPKGGMFALPEPQASQPGTSIRNAFAPPIPEQQQLVHPEIPGLGAPPTDMQQHQAKVAKIKSLGLDPATEKLAIEALVVPASILTAQQRTSGAANVGLSVIELTNPKDPTQKMMVQATRGGPFVRSGTQEVVPDEIARTWNKRIVSQPHYFVDAQGNPSILDTESLLAQGRQAGNVVSDVPGAHVREQWLPVTDQNQKIIGWTSGSRPGVFVPYNQTEPQGPQGSQAPQNAAARPDLYKTGRPEAAKTAETSIKTLLDSITRIDTLAKKHPEVSGRLTGNVEKVKAWAGYSPAEVDDLITETTNLGNTYKKMVSGGQVTPTEDARLSPVVPDIGQPPARLKNNIARFKRMVNIMVQVRGLGREGATDEELNAAMTEPTASGQIKSKTKTGGFSPNNPYAK